MQRNNSWVTFLWFASKKRPASIIFHHFHYLSDRHSSTDKLFRSLFKQTPYHTHHLWMHINRKSGLSKYAIVALSLAQSTQGICNLTRYTEKIIFACKTTFLPRHISLPIYIVISSLAPCETMTSIVPNWCGPFVSERLSILKSVYWNASHRFLGTHSTRTMTRCDAIRVHPWSSVSVLFAEASRTWRDDKNGLSPWFALL